MRLRRMTLRIRVVRGERGMREVGWRIFWVGEQVWFRFLKGEKRIFLYFRGRGGLIFVNGFM